MGFPGSSAGKESACNARDPSSIPGSGRSPGEGVGYPVQYSWASLVAQTVKNLPAMWETWIQSLGWKDSLEEGMATHSSIIARRILMDRGVWWATVHGIAKSQTWLSNSAQHPLQYSCLGNPMNRGAWWATVHEVARVRHHWATNSFKGIFYVTIN